MNIEKLSIKQIKDLMVKECNDELLTAIKNDARKGVQSIYKSYQREMKERQRVANLYTFENECRANGYKLIAGVDEVGRGPLAGPVVVASVILPENFFIEKTGKTTPGYYRQVLKITTEISVLAKEKG